MILLIEIYIYIVIINSRIFFPCMQRVWDRLLFFVLFFGNSCMFFNVSLHFSWYIIVLYIFHLLFSCEYSRWNTFVIKEFDWFYHLTSNFKQERGGFFLFFLVFINMGVKFIDKSEITRALLSFIIFCWLTLKFKGVLFRN